MAASGAADGVVLLHSVGGELLRSLRCPGNQPVQHVQLCALHLRLVVGSALSSTLHVCSLSGANLFECESASFVRCTLIGEDGMLFAGGVSGELRAWSLITGEQV